MLRAWLRSWRGLGAVIDGMIRLGYDVALTRHGDGGTPWRVLFFPAGRVHVSRTGSARGTTPWGAVLAAARETLAHEGRSGLPAGAFRASRRVHNTGPTAYP